MREALCIKEVFIARTETADQVEERKEEMTEEILTEVIQDNEPVQETIEDVLIKPQPHAGVEAQGRFNIVFVYKFNINNIIQ